MNLKSFPSEIDIEFLKRITNNPKLMRAITRKSMLYFFYLFFGEYATKPIAPFHREMFHLAEDETKKRIGIIAFRGSAKSTVWNTAYVLWAIMGMLKKKHVVVASHTQSRVSDHSLSIAREVEKNNRLRRYLGPFLERQERWSVPIRIIPKYDARITFVSVEEGIRGLRDGPHRPDLIIVDDIEDTNSVRTKEGRNKIFHWLTSELIPAGTPETKVVFIGNFLHDESALMRIKTIIDEKEMDGVFLKIPIADEEGNPTWPGMFPTKESLQEFKRGIPSESAWQLEYMLKYVPEADQIIKPEDIHYYDGDIPRLSYFDNSKGKTVEVLRGNRGVGVDLAISQKDTADYTAMVSGETVFFDRIAKIYIKPFPINERLDFYQTIERAKAIHRIGSSQFYVENVAYQQSAIEQMRRSFIPVIPMHAGGDKHSRFAVAAMYIKNGTVIFPRKGCESLIQQLTYFGIESHDDLLDALVYLILGITEHGGMYWPKVEGIL